MRITLSPQRRNDALTASRQGDVLTVNGEAFDFSGLGEGDMIAAGEVPCEWIAGPVERKDGQIRLTLILPHGPNPIEAMAFPAPIIDPPDGPIDLPRDPEPEPEGANDVEP